MSLTNNAEHNDDATAQQKLLCHFVSANDIRASCMYSQQYFLMMLTDLIVGENHRCRNKRNNASIFVNYVLPFISEAKVGIRHMQHKMRNTLLISVASKKKGQFMSTKYVWDENPSKATVPPLQFRRAIIYISD